MAYTVVMVTVNDYSKRNNNHVSNVHFRKHIEICIVSRFSLLLKLKGSFIICVVNLSSCAESIKNIIRPSPDDVPLLVSGLPESVPTDTSPKTSAPHSSNKNDTKVWLMTDFGDNVVTNQSGWPTSESLLSFFCLFLIIKQVVVGLLRQMR